MKSKLLVLVGIFLCSSIFAQTTIKNGEQVSGTWTKSKSPYIIEGEAIVPAGKTLKIKPGVEIKFKTGENTDYLDEDGFLNQDFNVGFLRVEGVLIAKGKKNSLITFTGTNKYGKWGNVFFYNTKDIVLDYCKFENAQYLRAVVEDDNSTGAITFINSTGTVTNCIATKSWTGFNCKQGASPKVSNCVFYDNEYGIESNSDSKPTVINTIVWNNANCFYINPGATVKISYSLLQDDYLAEGVFSKGELILSKDPKLDNLFKLKEYSPCIKSGEKGANMGIKW
jgi:hypothetical protein